MKAQGKRAKAEMQATCTPRIIALQESSASENAASDTADSGSSDDESGESSES